MEKLTWKELLKLRWGAYLAFLLIFVGLTALCTFFLAKEEPDFIWLGAAIVLVALGFLAVVVTDDKGKFRKCPCGKIWHPLQPIKRSAGVEICHKCGKKIED